MTKSRKTGNGGGCATAVIVVTLFAAVAYFAYRYYGEAPPPAPRALPTPTPAVQTPEPTPPPAPATPFMATPTPAVTPVSKVTPAPEPRIALTALGRRQLPVRVMLVKATQFPIVFNGQQGGTVAAPAGSMVGLIDVRSDTSIEVQYGESTLTVPVNSTDIVERVRTLSHYVINAPTPPPTPFTGFSTPKAVAPAPVRKPAGPIRFGTLVREDFDGGAGWGSLAPEAVGTIDEQDSNQPSQGLRSATLIASGPLPVHANETDLGKLTLAFSLSASAAHPVTVRVESFDDTRRRTGGLETTIYPAAPDFYQRYALDLSGFKPSADGHFDPAAAFVGFSFVIGGDAWKEAKMPEIRLDNVHYAKPAYYVSTKGKDFFDGHSPGSAFAHVQKALDEAGPGDIIVVMEGTYDGGMRSVASFPRAGTPAAWISLKNYPGQKPTFTCTGWNTILIGKGTKDDPSEDPSLAYLEIRGLHIRGEGDVARKKYPEAMNKPDSRTNTNGISTDGRYMRNPIHHIRIADNLVEFCPAGGIGVGETDWASVENNVCHSNCWTTIYAPSGISILGATNFDTSENVYKHLVRNNVCYRNETFEKWAKIDKYSDGNGIIIDVNQHTEANPNGGFLGRTLVQSNLCYDNGGSGLHSFKSNRVDFINNTAYLNSASKHLEYPQMFANGSEDVRFCNNICVAPVNPANEKPERVIHGESKTAKVVFTHNLYFGGNVPPEMGMGDTFGDPRFVHASVDPAVADFHLKPGSMAAGAGFTEPFSPILDLDGKPRAAHPARGAYEKQQP